MHFILYGREKKSTPHHSEPLLVIGMRQMPPSRGRIKSEFPQVAADLQLSLNFRAWLRRSEQRYARLLSCSLSRTGIARQLGQIGARFKEKILPKFGDKGRNDLSIYLLQPRKKNVVQAFPLAPISPTPRTFFGPRAIVSCCFHLVVSFSLLIPARPSQMMSAGWQ